MDKKLVPELRKRLSDVLTPDISDSLLIKWLKAGNYCVRKSEYLYREFLDCRALHDIDHFENIKKPEVLEKYEFVSPLGFAKDGTPLTYVAMGRGDYRGILHSVSNWEIGLYCYACMEKDLQKGKEHGLKIGKEINDITYIIDMEEFSLKKGAHQEVLEVAFDLFHMVQDHTPARWKVIMLVNAAFYVYQAFNIFKPILRAFILQDLYVVSKEQTPELLLKYVDADVLPAFLGGNRVDSNGDPMCREFIKFGGPVPEIYYLTSFPKIQTAEEGVESIYIRPKCCYNYSLVVPVAKSRAHIEIRTEGGSIAVSILFKELGNDISKPGIPSIHEHFNLYEDGSKVRLISPAIKLQGHITPTDTHMIFPWRGIYIFRFDNSFSWISGKTVTYRFRLEPPSNS